MLIVFLTGVRWKNIGVSISREAKGNSRAKVKKLGMQMSPLLLPPLNISLGSLPFSLLLSPLLFRAQNESLRSANRAKMKEGQAEQRERLMALLEVTMMWIE